MTLRTVLLSLQALLCKPEPDDPQDAVVAKQYRENFNMFQQTARHWAAAYAGARDKSPELSDKVNQLVSMGFEKTVARVALSSNLWDVQKAAELILSGHYS